MPVSKQKWLQLPAGQRGKLTYQQYVKWAHKRTAQRQAAATVTSDPFAPLPPGQIRSMAKQQVLGLTQPVIREITASLGRQQKAGVADINTSTAAAVKALAPLAGQMGQTYDQSYGQMQAGGAEIANFLKGTGLTQQADLASTFSQSGLPSQPGNVLAQTGAQAGAMALGYGRSALDEQAAQRASEVGFAQKQPGFARRAGAANIATLNRDYANRLADAVGGVTQQVPGMVNTAYQSLLDREFQKATAKKGFELDTDKLNAAKKNAQTAADNPDIDPTVSTNANDGLARDGGGNLVPDGNGGYKPWAKTVPKPPAKGPGSKQQKRIDDAQKEFYPIAKKARDELITYLNPPKGGTTTIEHGGGKANKVINAKREAVVKQIASLWSQRFPGLAKQNPKWLAKQISLTLRAGGWDRDADIWLAASQGKPIPQPGAPVAPPKKGGKPVTGGKPVSGGKPTTTPSKFQGVGIPPSIGEDTPKRTRFLRGVTGRADALTGGKADRYAAYAQLTNYILREGFSLGYDVNPRIAWLTAQRALEQTGYKYEKELGNPGLYIKGWRMWRPHKG